jgi:hypothetical protein
MARVRVWRRGLGLGSEQPPLQEGVGKANDQLTRQKIGCVARDGIPQMADASGEFSLYTILTNQLVLEYWKCAYSLPNTN